MSFEKFKYSAKEVLDKVYKTNELDENICKDISDNLLSDGLVDEEVVSKAEQTKKVREGLKAVQKAEKISMTSAQAVSKLRNVIKNIAKVKDPALIKSIFMHVDQLEKIAGKVSEGMQQN